MRKIVFSVPVKTRLPAFAWALAATICLSSLTSGLVADKSDAGRRFVLAEVQATPQAQATPQGKDAPGPDNGSDPIPDLKPGESLSEHLDRNQGVITPPPTGDSDIYTDAPNPNPGTTPVIPPGDVPVQPN
jgi:hypothetical protein